MKASRLKVIVNIVLTVALSTAVFFTRPTTRELLLKDPPTEEEWKQMEDYALEVAKMTSYDIGGLREKRTNEYIGKMNAVISLLYREEVVVEVTMGYNHVIAIYPVLSTNISEVINPIYQKSSETTSAENKLQGIVEQISPQYQKDGTVCVTTQYNYENGSYTRYRKYGTDIVRESKRQHDFINLAVLYSAVSLVIGFVCAFVTYRILKIIFKIRALEKIKECINIAVHRIINDCKKVLKIIYSAPGNIIRWFKETTER